MNQHIAATIGQRYVDAVNAGDLEGLLALFADEAVVEHPRGRFTDRRAMAKFYGEVVLAARTVTRIVTTARDGAREWIEIEATSPLGETGTVVHAADCFEVDAAGRITRLAIYYR